MSHTSTFILAGDNLSLTPMNSHVSSEPYARSLLVPDHELLQVIASGSYGEVWLAQSVIGTPRAIKIVRRSRFEHAQDFEREFRGLKEFSALERALARRRRPEIHNTDQGSQFTSAEWLSLLEGRGIRVSMDGRGRAFDNIMIERLWRTVKWEHVFLRDHRSLGICALGSRNTLSTTTEGAGIQRLKISRLRRYTNDDQENGKERVQSRACGTAFSFSKSTS